MSRHIKNLTVLELACMRCFAGELGSDYIDNIVRLADGLDCDRDELIRTLTTSLCKTVRTSSFKDYQIGNMG